MNRIFSEEDIFVRSFEPKSSSLDLWFIHGFPESGLSFRELFNSDLPKKYRIYVPDLPGFGVSPTLQNQSVDSVVERLQGLIRSVSKDRKIGLVAHSWGGVVGVELAKILEKQVVGYIDVEGSIVDPDYFFKEKALDPKTQAKEFSEYYIDFQHSVMNESEAQKRYYASIRFADPLNLLPWIRSNLSKIKDGAVGDRYKALKCPKSYFWTTNGRHYVHVDWLDENHLKHQSFDNCGHWPMIDVPKNFYSAVENFFESLG